MYINWDFSCQVCAHKEDFLVDSKEEFPMQDCPNCGGKHTMLKVYSPVAASTSDSLSFAIVPPERRHEFKVARLKNKGKNSKRPSERESATAIAADMGKHKT